MGFRSCSSWLQSTGSRVVVHGLSCLVACGVFPDQGWNPGLQIFYHWTIREAQAWLLTEPIKEFHTLHSAQGCPRAISQAPELRRWSNPPLLSGSQQWPWYDGKLYAANNSQTFCFSYFPPTEDGAPWWLSAKTTPCSAGHKGDTGSVPGWGRPPGGQHGNPLQYSCLENSKDRGAWWVTVHGAPKSRHDWATEHTAFSKGKRRSWAGPAAAKSCQSCLTLCDPIDGSPPGSSPWDSPGKNTGVGCHFLSIAWKWKVKVKSLSHVWLFATPWTVAYWMSY